MSFKVVGIIGFKDSGKDSIANVLINNYGYKKDSFAASLKDACAIIFNWPRHLLEGDTYESRQWREEVDSYWSDILGKEVTPRYILQYVGTEIFRNHLHPNIWVSSVEKRILESKNNIVITDCRFPNEIQKIKELNGTLIRVKRGNEPQWFEIAKDAVQNNNKEKLSYLYSIGIHPSEYSWIGYDFDYLIDNDTSLSDLENKVINLFEDIKNDMVSN